VHRIALMAGESIHAAIGMGPIGRLPYIGNRQLVLPRNSRKGLQLASRCAGEIARRSVAGE